MLLEYHILWPSDWDVIPLYLQYCTLPTIGSSRIMATRFYLGLNGLNSKENLSASLEEKNPNVMYFDELLQT